MNTRRDLLKWGLLTGGAALAGMSIIQTASSQQTGPCVPLPPAGEDPMPLPDGLPTPSPATTPWAVELPLPADLQPVASLMPEPDPAAHQLPDGFSTGPANILYEMHVKEVDHSFHPELPLNKVFGYGGTVPGPTIRAQYGQPILVRFFNELPANHVGIGIPEISTHVHNGHQEWQSDGHPTNFYPSGQHKDHHYTLRYAGNDPTEALRTLWYHDHRLDFTAQNVYKGLAGFFLLQDHVDTWNEQDPSPTALRLPSGPFDVPLAIQDKAFDSAGNLFFDPFEFDGFLGDKWVVNGKIQPFFKVAKRKYRFRLLAASNSRFWHFRLSNGAPMTLIATDGNLLPSPIVMPQGIEMCPAQRRDVIIDFSQYPDNTEIFLENVMEQVNGRGPTDRLLLQGSAVLKFIVEGDAADPSQVPANLMTMPTMDLATAQLSQRTFVFGRSQGAWTINGELFDGSVPRFTVKQGVPEIWTLKNGGGGWSHPIHIHLEEFRMLQRNGALVAPYEVGRQDVVCLHPNDEVKLYIRFRTFRGRYVMHCHNTLHEDHSMMLRFDVEP